MTPEPPTQSRAPVELAVVRSLPYLLVGLVASVPLLLVPIQSDPLLLYVIHLSVLVVVGIVVTVRIMPLADADWFVGFGWSAMRRRFGSAVVLVVLPTGLVGLLALASSAALRFDPSLQFLQLLSALDIAWAAAALMLGVRWLWGRTPSIIAGVLLGIACVYALWNYLDQAGLGPDGEWVVRASDLMRLVLPTDTIAAVVAIAALLSGIRRSVLPDGAGQRPVVGLEDDLR